MSAKMAVKFDLDANAAYVKLRNGRVNATKEGKLDSLEVLLDYAKDGQLVGVELLNLKKALELYVGPRIPEIAAKATS
ncbi:MAG: DUF2283 domain-containing protein [Nitrososphaerota archaeon]|nr:DUF2283 domain-containing protein [Nitrososphaerota archaeon]